MKYAAAFSLWLALLFPILGFSQDEAAIRYFDLGKQYLENGYADDAIVEFNRALILEPDRIEYLYSLGLAYQKAKRIDEAETTSESKEAEVPDDPIIIIPEKKVGKVPNIKGRVASVLSLVFWAIFILFIVIRGDYSTYPMLMLVIFILLEAITVVRLYQEYVENGAWLE